MVNFHLFTPAKQVAIDNLRSNYVKGFGIQAGGTHYISQIWLRDQAFASFGSCVLGDYSIVKEGIETCIKFQDNEGNFPVSIGIMGGFAADLEWGHLARTDSALDIPSNFIMMVANLYNYTQDSELLGYLPACQKAMGCLLNKTGANRLIVQEAGQDWMDKWSRSGIVTYTNVLYYKALIDLASLERAAGDTGNADNHTNQALTVKNSINALLWNGTLGYYKDTLLSEGFDTGANLLAILYGVASKENATEILSNLHYSMPVTPSFIGGTDGWIWIASAEIIARWLLNDTEGAQHVADNVTNIIIKYGNVPEYLDGDKINPISEYNYPWNAGMFIYALNITNIVDKTEFAPWNPASLISIPFLVFIVPLILISVLFLIFQVGMRKSIIQILKENWLLLLGLLLFFLSTFILWKIFWIAVILSSEIDEAIFTQSFLPIGQSALYFCTLYIILYVLFLGLSLASTRRERRSIRSIIIRKSLFTILISFCAMLAGLFTLYFFLFAP